MYHVQGFKDDPDFDEPIKVHEIKNIDRDEALKNLEFFWNLGKFDQVTVTPVF